MVEYSSLTDFKNEICKTRPKKFTFLTENQDSLDRMSPIKFNLTFRRMEVSEYTRTVGFFEDVSGGKVVLLMVKCVKIIKRDAVGTIFRVCCKDVNAVSGFSNYYFIAQ